MVGAKPRSSCKELFIKLEILTLPCLYLYLIILNIKKDELNHITNEMIHNYNTRHRRDLRLPFSRLSICQNSHVYKGIICYNHFVNMFGAIDNFHKFKRTLSKHLIDNAFYTVEDFLNH